MPLGLKPGEYLVSSRKIHPELYQQYLRVRAKVRASQGLSTYVPAVKELESVVATEPGFAPAWAYMSRLILSIQDLDLYAPARKTERFKTLVRKAGLVDYWKMRGWPDLCHPTTGDDFVCN